MTAFWQNRSTLVTGASGLVGGWLVRSLLGVGAEVVCLVRDWVPRCILLNSDLVRQVTMVRGDVTDQQCVERILGEYEVDTVFHLAAQTVVPIANRNPVGTFHSNIAGTWTLLEACRRSPRVKQVVVASSDKAYGEAQKLPYDENTPLRGVFPYDVSKSCADLIAHSYAATYGMPVAITRCGNFYGGGDLNWSRIVPGTIRAILSGQRPVIRSDGSLVRDYFYVEDGAAAYMQLAQCLARSPSLHGRAFNFSNETQVSVLQLVQRILDLMQSDLEPIIQGEAKHEIVNQCLSATSARRELDWRASFSLEEGLLRTIGWYREYLCADRPTLRRAA